MKDLGEYIFSIAVAASILGIVSTFVSSKSSAGVLVRLIGGLYLTIIALQPIVNFNFDKLPTFWDGFTEEMGDASSHGEELARSAMADIIKHRTEAYILDKAGSYGGQVTVEVILDEGEIQSPEAVIIRTDLPEHAQLELQSIVEQELDIPKENQTWCGLP